LLCENAGQIPRANATDYRHATITSYVDHIVAMCSHYHVATGAENRDSVYSSIIGLIAGDLFEKRKSRTEGTFEGTNHDAVSRFATLINNDSG
jgi:hypothetical protein